MSDLSVFFQSVKLPVMSEVAHALIRSLHHPEVGLTEVREIVAKDPALTARVLRAANSAALGLGHEVGTLEAAVAMIGLNQVRTLALTACMNVSFPVVAGLDRTAFWKNCMACAGYAQWLAQAIHLDAQEAWLCGMLVRLGELIIGQTRPEILTELGSLPSLPGDRWVRQQHKLGFTEAHISAELARRWRFPPGIVHTLAQVSDPLVQAPWLPMAGVVHLAGWLADMAFSAPEVVDALPQALIERLGLQANWMRQHLPDPDNFLDINAL